LIFRALDFGIYAAVPCSRIANRELAMVLKPQDILVLLKLVAIGKEPLGL
jgi:hypothetical protein